MKRPLLVIDGDLFAHRSYHALPKSIRRTGNRGGGAIVGFANFLLRLYEAEQPRAVLVGWDTLGAPTYRQRLFPQYQSGRQFDAELVDQLEVLPRFVQACGFANAKAAGYEADDFLAAAAASEERRHGTVLVASGDRDAFQLASAATTILHPMKAGELARIGPAEVRERYGVEPHQVPDFIALRGDPSDKLPGARGVGPKGAATLLRRYGSLEQAIAEGRLTEQARELKLYKKIATMDASAPLPGLGDQTPTWNHAAALAREWDLDRLARRLAEIGEAWNRRGRRSPGQHTGNSQTRFPAGAEDCDVQHQQREPPASQSARLAQRFEARCGLPSGAQVVGRCVPCGDDTWGRLRSHLARRTNL